MKIVLAVITGDNVPSFKNSKRAILDKNTSRQRTLTPAKMKARMDKITVALVSELLLRSQTIEEETLTGCSRLSWIVSKMPADDSWQWIPTICASVERVASGQEGFDIEITEIPQPTPPERHCE